MNNRPLTYVEGDNEESQVLTPSMIMWGKNCHILEDIDVEENDLAKMQGRLSNARQLSTVSHMTCLLPNYMHMDLMKMH